MLNFTKKSFLAFVLLLSTVVSSAQIYTPVKWSFSTKKIDEKKTELVFSATIQKGWHMYSQFLTMDDGPIATTFTFNTDKAYAILGKVKESKPIDHFDPVFGANLQYFENTATFKQIVERKTLEAFTVSGALNFMACDDKMCVPPEDVDFEFQIPAAEKKVQNDKEEIKGLNDMNDSAVAIVPGNTEKGNVDTSKAIIKEKPADEFKPAEEELTFWGIFIAGFLGGLLALMTPCVFPMIPLTVSFFTKQSKTRSKGIINAFLYGLSIIIIYVGFGFILTKSLGPDALNALASNVIMNLAFFLIFTVFAISFFGAFEITLPSSWVNKADAQSDKGGLIGIFFMAFTLSLVSFSCTGPIIGTLLVQAAVGGNNLGPIIGMTGFAVALALPFGLFAAFPGWLNSLPKSGGWLNSVKVVLGFLELALALKFLSTVDLAYGWGVITRELFIALWIIIFTLMGFYLLGKLKFSHDSELKYISIPRLFMAILTFSFVVYLVPGMWGAPLKIISGFPPPVFYTEGWSLNQPQQASTAGEVIEGVDRSHCPHNLPCFHNYDLALAYAKKTGKPLMVDFTGWSCVNCRKMEDNVWVDPRVLKILEKDYVLVSLYVDDKTSLKEEEKYVSSTTGKKIKTEGNKWSDLQTTRFKTNSQPYYVLLDHQEKMLVKPSGYDPDIEKYIEFLEAGKKKFKESKN